MQFSPIVENITTNMADNLKLLPPNSEGSNNAVLAPWTVDAKKIGEFYIAIFDEWVKKDVGKYFVQLFDAHWLERVGSSRVFVFSVRFVDMPPLWSLMGICMPVTTMCFLNINWKYQNAYYI